MYCWEFESKADTGMNSLKINYNFITKNFEMYE
jgi:hypothetical protein